VDPKTVSPANAGPGDYVIADPLKVVGGGPVARFDKNKAAITLRNTLIEAGRAPTREEQEILAGYTGWGSFGQELFKGTWTRPAPKPGWEARDKWLRDNLGQSEWEGLQTSIINAHYTDPPTVMAMWDMVRRLGFTGGRTLEPSIGIGNFYGLMPADMTARSQRAGIELDEVTGSMAQMLYPQANIQIKGYEKSTTPDNFYDLVIGNWPFFETGPADRRYNRLSPTLHDYFFLKALDQTRPGGLVVGITTKGTMDKKGVGARMEMARKGELVAAFRLPSGAFEEYAGTAVVTDIIILRKREKPVQVVDKDGWIETKDHDTKEGTKVPVNEYFHRNPSHVIGEIDFGHGTTTMRPGLIVHRPADMMAQLRRVVDLVPEAVFAPNAAAKSITYVANHTSDRTNALTATAQGLFIVQGEYLAPANEVAKYVLKDAAKTAARENQLRSLIDMRRMYGELIDAERTGKADGSRQALRTAYEAFVKENGPLSESFGLGYLEKIDDPFYPSLAALEMRSEGAKGKPVYRPAAILTRSTMRGAVKMEAPTIADAFVLARNEAVNPTPERIAEIAKQPVDKVRADLVDAGAAFQMPNGDFSPSDLYLSGNVREKMREAKAALEAGDTAMERNVAALATVMPADVPYYKIETQMGATWVPGSTYADFIAHMLGMSKPDGIAVTFQGGAWKVSFDSDLNRRPEARSGFGSPNVYFKRLVRAAIANQTINVKRKDRDGNEYIDDDATKEVNGKIADMRLKFGEWLWRDPTRRVELEREYNEVRNAYATPKFDGSFLGFQGMALSLGRGPFNLREHQVNAIWRALVTRKSLNAHEVGTGKTFTMGGIAVESRRYGIAKKPLLFAHNANSKSVAHEIQMMYPAAKVLYVDNLGKENLKTRMMQIANDDWDVVVMPHSVIDRLGFKEETLMAMAREEILELEIAAQEAADEDGVQLTAAMLDDEKELNKLRSPTAKQLVKQRMKIIATIQKLSMQASKEDSIAFEDMGVDMVLVDEAHEFKKPPIATKMRMKGLQTQTSDRSIAMMFLTRYVRNMNNGGNVHLFTGTPITNTMTEVFHIMRYIMQEEMQNVSLADWDGWFGSFAREVNDVELNPAGEYEAVTRLQSFINVPELRRMIGQYMDVVFSDDMPEMLPRSVGGKRLGDPALTERDKADLMNGRTENAPDRPYKKVINESSDMTPEQLTVFGRVQAYARSWRNMSKKDRKEAMLAGAPESPIIHEGIAARASFDVRLVNAIANAGKEGSPEMAPHPDSKPSRVHKNLLELYNSDKRVTQVVFMEQGMSTSVTRREGPVGAKKSVNYPAFSTMKDMVERLVQAGIPREQIATVTGATSKDKRKEIADAMNAGTVRIVFGSSDSLGVGVNMQKNLRAMHHMDAPWMPGELEQRNGRGHRQGNQWNTVLEYRYLTDRLDGRRWQVLAIKQRFITDFMKSKGDVRVIEGDAASDEGGDILSTFSEAAGDPRILMREKFKKKLEQLQSRERLHGQAQADARAQIKSYSGYAATNRRMLAELRANGTKDKIAAFIESQRGDGFRASIDGTEFTVRAEASEAMEKWLEDNLRRGDDREIGTFGGLPLRGVWPNYASRPDVSVTVAGVKVEGGSFASIESRLRFERDTIESSLESQIASYEKTVAHAKTVEAEPFHLGAQLAAVQTQLDDLTVDIERNPVAPPFWLRAGAPADTEVFRKGKPFVVTGHRWSADGWFVLAADSKGETAIPYTEAQDKQGLPLYEPREFEPPAVQQGSAGTGVPVTAPAPQTNTVMIDESSVGDLPQTGSPAADDANTAFSRARNAGTSTRDPNPAAIKGAQALNDALVEYGLGAEWANAYQAVALPDALSGVRQAFQAAFGRDVRPVAPTAAKFDIFNGVYIPSQPAAVYVNVDASPNFVSIAGHELWHTIRRSRPELIEWYRSVAAPYYKNFPEYQRKLNALLQPGEKPYSADKALEELEADFLGDSLTDGAFLKKLADASPTKFREFMLRVQAWLRTVAGKFKGLGSSEYVTDINALQEHLRTVMVAYAEGKPLPSMGGVAFSRAARTGTEDEARVAGFTLKAYRGVSKASPFNDTGTTWLTTNRKVAEAYAEEVMGYDDPTVLTVMVKPDGLPRVDASRLTDEQREAMQSDGFGNPQALGIYDRSDDHPLGGSAGNVTVIHAPRDAVFMVDSGGALFSRAPATTPFFGPDATPLQRNNTITTGDRPGARFSRTAPTPGPGMAQKRPIRQQVRNTLSDMLGSAGAKVSWWDKTLGTQYAKAEKFPAYKRVFDQVQQYLEDTSSLANEAADQAKSILPKMETWKDLQNFGLNKTDAAAVAGPVFTGTLTDKKVYDDAELRSRFKLTPAQVGQYRSFLAAVNTSLDQAVTADVLRLIGDKNPALRELAITDRAAFRQGVDEFLTQQIEAGDPGGKLAEMLEQIRDKYAQIANLKSEGYAPLMRFGKYKVHITDPDGATLFFGLYEGKTAANAAARDLAEDPEFKGATIEQGVLSQEQYKMFSAMPLDSLEMFAEAMGVDEKAVFQEYIKLAKNNRNAMKRLLKRKGTAGFSEDVPRVLAAFVTGNARMSAAAMNLPAAKQAALDVKDGDVQDEAVKLVEAVQNPQETAGVFRGLMFMNFIGGSIASAVVNLTQPITMTLPYLSQFGGMAKASARLMAAGKIAASGKSDDTGLKMALKRAEADGIVSPQEIHHLTAQAMGTFGTNPVLQRAAFIWAAPFSLAEQFNRRVTFIAAYQTATQQGIEQPFEFAERAVTETQGLYNKANAPNWARNPIGASALTFKQFSIHYLEWMGRMYRSGPKGKQAVLYALALLILAAGTDGLPGADDLDDLIDTLGQALGYDLNLKKSRRDFVANTLGMGDVGADVVARGLSALPGIPMDVSLRMSMGNLLPATGIFLRSNTDRSRDLLEVAGPAGGLIKQYMDAGQKALRGDFGGAAVGATPVAIQNAAKAVDMWSTGEARDTMGRRIMDADTTDGLMRFLGFNPQAIAREADKMGMIRRSEQLAKNVEGEIAAAWARALVDKDAEGVADARQKLKDWNEDNPTAKIQITMAQLRQRTRKLQQDRSSRFITSISPERRQAVAEALQ